MPSSISWIYCTILFQIAFPFSISINLFKPLYQASFWKPSLLCFWPLKQNCCKFLENYIKTHWKNINSLAWVAQNTRNLDKQSPLNLFDLHCSFRAVQFSDKLKPFLNGPLKIFVKPTEVMYDLQAQDGKTVHAHIEIIWIHFIVRNLGSFLTLK